MKDDEASGACSAHAQMRNAYIFVEKVEGWRPLADLCVDGSIILKLMLI
jgi:hypothetical protein